MPAPNLPHLQADPRLLLTWLQSNLLLSGYVTNVPAGRIWMRFFPAPVAVYANTAQSASGVAMDVYAMSPTGVGAADGVPAFVCNYDPGACRHVDLDNTADYVFTTTMNGCTFGVGPVGAGGGRRVSHANTGGQTHPQQLQTWMEHGVAVNDQTIAMLEPSLYRRMSRTLNATTFGIRSGGIWRFYFQLFESLGQATYRVHGVFPIPGT